MFSVVVWIVRSRCPVTNETVDSSTLADLQQRNSCHQRCYVYVGQHTSYWLLIGEGGSRCQRQGWCHQLNTPVPNQTTTGAVHQVSWCQKKQEQQNRTPSTYVKRPLAVLSEASDGKDLCYTWLQPSSRRIRHTHKEVLRVP